MHHQGGDKELKKYLVSIVLGIANSSGIPCTDISADFRHSKGTEQAQKLF